MKQKNYFIILSFILILSGCTYYNGTVETIQTNIIQKPWHNSIAYKEPNITFFPFLIRELKWKDLKIDMSLEFKSSESMSGTYLPSRCIRSQIAEVIETCAIYTKMRKDFLQKHTLLDIHNPKQKSSTFISETRTSGSDINLKYALWIHSINPITEPIIGFWYAKDYLFDKWDFVKKTKNIWWFWEDTIALTKPILWKDTHFVMTNDVTASSKSNNTYAQTIFEDIPFNFQNWSILSLSLSWIELQNISLNSLVINMPYVSNWKWALLVSKSWHDSILNTKSWINKTNESDILYCNEDTCNIHFSTWIIKDIQELQFQY